MAPSTYQIELFKKLSPILGIDCKVTNYGDENNERNIRILSCPDPVDGKVKFYSTLGMSEQNITDLDFEIMLTGFAIYEKIPNILSTSAFFVLKDGWKCEIGRVFETLVEMYYPNLDMKHLYFSSPYLWEDKLENFAIDSGKIDFFLGIPISDKELEYKNENGHIALEDLFEKQEINIFDLNRKSLI